MFKKVVVRISTFYVKNEQVNDKIIRIIGPDVNHIKNVLRYQVNDTLEVCDQSQTRYYTKIDAMSAEEIVLKILETAQNSTEAKVKIDLYQGLPKSDKMDFIVQKGTELGVSTFIPVLTDRVIVKIDEKNGAKKVERWSKIAEEAAKQSGRQLIPTVENIMKLENFVENLSKYDIVIVPYECEKESTLKNVLENTGNNVESIAVVIGPEGGFSEKDIAILEKIPSVKKVSLGKRILRTETAGIAAVAMILYQYDL